MLLFADQIVLYRLALNVVGDFARRLANSGSF